MFDLEILVPVSSVFSERLEDFKKCGLVNIGKRKVLLHILVSGESIDDADCGWPLGVEPVVIREESPEYVANLYRHYTKMDAAHPRARWFIRLDDDSCTDVDGLLTNLDCFYSCDQPYPLGELNNFGSALAGGEGGPYGQYKSFLGRFEPISALMKNEIECGITSAAGLEKILGNPDSLSLLKHRATLGGGFGDCVFALAAALAGVYPIDCPFLTHLPLIHNFSLFGGLKNHIHKISRVGKGVNFGGRCSYEGFSLLNKAAAAKPNKAEQNLEGRRFLLEGDNFMKILELNQGYTARLKLDKQIYNWYESDGELLILNGNDVIYRMILGDSGLPSCDGHSVTEISLASKSKS